MLRTIRIGGLAVALLALSAAAKDDPRTELESLKREQAALESLRAEKLEALEKRESQRWEARYKAAAQTKESEDRLRSLEETFSRLSGDAGRLEEDWVKARNDADEKKGELETAQEGAAAFTAQVKRQVDEAAGSVSSDFPAGLEARTAAYSKASGLLAAKEPDVSAALETFLDAGLDRLDLTRTQALESRQEILEDGRTVNVWRLRLGTIFMGELEKEGRGASQILLRTGTLQGKTFAWREDLAKDYNARLRAAVQGAVQSKETSLIPFDVLQYKSTGSGFVRGEQKNLWERFRDWFKAGGVTLYPLFAVGFLALLMIGERLVFFARRSANAEAFMKGFWPYVDRRDWRGAAEYSARSRSSLGRTLGALVEHAEGSREAAEKAVQEVLLKEIPGHEKRLSLLAAFGTAAPLLGLLGTVSGLVALFKTLNQLGSNDPKVLAGGISEALVNTETGLAIAIPVLLMHGWLQERVDTLGATLSAKSLEVLNRIWPAE